MSSPLAVLRGMTHLYPELPRAHRKAPQFDPVEQKLIHGTDTRHRIPMLFPTPSLRTRRLLIAKRLETLRMMEN